MPPTRDTLNAAAKHSDLSNFLEHIAWREILEPALANERRRLEALLTQAVLGRRFSTSDGSPLSPEQLAALSWALTLLESKISSILRQGDVALEKIRTSGLQLSEIKELK